MTEAFYSIAGIAVAFAGFTGIVIAVRKPTDVRASAFARSRLLDLLLASLGATFFAYLPEVILAFGVDGMAGWQASALMFAIFHTVQVAVVTNTAGRRLVFTRLDWLLVPFGAIVLMAQWATGLGAFGGYVQAVYLVALLWLLFVAAYQFAQLLVAYDQPNE